MDDLEFRGKDLEESLSFIRLVNLLGGGQRAITSGLSRLLRGWPRNKPLRILDVGCGLGDMGPAVIRWGESRRLVIRYLGLDQNRHILQCARDRAKKFSDTIHLEFVQGDLFGADLPEADVILASMVFHHLDDPTVVKAIRHLRGKCRVGLVINDLERTLPAYLACFFLSRFMRSPRSRSDALISVRKGFSLPELERLLAQAGVPDKKGAPPNLRRVIGWRLLGIVPADPIANKRYNV